MIIQFIVVSSFFLQDYISFIFSLVFSFLVFIFEVVVFLLFLEGHSAFDGVNLSTNFSSPFQNAGMSGESKGVMLGLKKEESRK